MESCPSPNSTGMLCISPCVPFHSADTAASCTFSDRKPTSAKWMPNTSTVTNSVTPRAASTMD